MCNLLCILLHIITIQERPLTKLTVMTEVCFQCILLEKLGATCTSKKKNLFINLQIVLDFNMVFVQVQHTNFLKHSLTKHYNQKLEQSLM